MGSIGSPDAQIIDLRSLADEDVSSLPRADLRAGLLNLIGAIAFLQAQLTRRVGAFDARSLAVDDGCRSTHAWLVAFGGLSAPSAGDYVRGAQVLRELPALARASERGEVSADQLRQVTRLARRAGVEAVTRAEPVLVEAAARLDASDFGRVCDRVRAHADPDGAAPDAALDFNRRGVSLAPFDGMVMLEGQLDPEGGAALMTALDALMPPPARNDPRTARQRRADALVELARGALSGGRLPTTGGARPQVGVLVTPAQLIGGAPAEPVRRTGEAHGAPAGEPPDLATLLSDPVAPWLNWFGDVPAPVAQRLACDADVWRVVLDPATGQPVDVGRTHRLVPPWVRKALVARDRGCRFPGCRAPAAWTDAHHAMPWSHGGRTDLGNQLLLCRFHHVLVHEGGWKIRLDPETGEVGVTRPDGTRYEIGDHRIRGLTGPPPAA